MGEKMAYHLSIGDETALDNETRFCSKPGGIPDHQVRQLANLNAADQVSETLGKRWVNGILAHIPLYPIVIRTGALILLQEAPLHLVLMRSVPRPQDDLATATHGLRIGTHHADGTKIVENVLGSNGLSADATLREGDVLGDVLGQMVANHQHVEVFV